jgi:CBS domain containing-hemolysin-like protein
MELLFGFLLILATGFFAGSETAVYRANWIRLTNWASRNISGARSALQLLDHRESTVVATLVGTNLCVVFATELFSHFFEGRYGPASATAAVVLVITLTIILGEYVPKAIAQAFPDRWLRQTVLPLSVSRTVFAPAVVILSGVARLLAADRKSVV